MSSALPSVIAPSFRQVGSIPRRLSPAPRLNFLCFGPDQVLPSRTRIRNLVTNPFALIGPRDPVDLHLHTLASDGFWETDELINTVANRGLHVVAIADHDNQRSVARAIELGAERG